MTKRKKKKKNSRESVSDRGRQDGCWRGDVRPTAILARHFDGRLPLRLRFLDRWDEGLCRSKADKSGRSEEKGRIHRWIFPFRTPRAREPHRPRRHALGQARRRSYQRGSDRPQELSAAHVVERHGGKANKLFRKVLFLRTLIFRNVRDSVL